MCRPLYLFQMQKTGDIMCSFSPNKKPLYLKHETGLRYNGSLFVLVYQLAKKPVFWRFQHPCFKTRIRVLFQAKIVDPGSTILPIFVSFRNKDAAPPRVSGPVFSLREKTKSAKPWGKTQQIETKSIDVSFLNKTKINPKSQ